MKSPQFETLQLEKIVGGGQTLGTLDNGRKAFVWGGLPGESVTIRIGKKKSHFVEGIVTEVIEASPERIAPLDPESYLSTSPWQIMTFEAEQHYKAALIEEAFELHDIVLPDPIDVYTDNRTTRYRNKVEFSWYSTAVDDSGEAETLDLAFFRRGSKGKIVVDDSSLLPTSIVELARAIRDLLRTKHLTARQLKTLLIRCDQQGNCVWQLYIKDESASVISADEAKQLPAQGGEVIYSDPRSPASRITKRLEHFGNTVLTDTILGVPFRYATEGFFQVNIPVYEQALRDMQRWIDVAERRSAISQKATIDIKGEVQPESLLPGAKSDSARSGGFGEIAEEARGIIASTIPNNDNWREPRRAEAASEKMSSRVTIDLYSGVGSIGLTIGGDNCTLVEIDENAVREMKRNIEAQGSGAVAVLAPSEKALEYITSDVTVIVDPPRAGMHADVINKLLEAAPPRIIYLSCNPVTQARDVALLAEGYGICAHRGYNFFPRTPHIEHLVVLDRLPDSISEI